MMKVRIRMAVMDHTSRVSVMKTGIYMKYAKELVEKGEAYYCFCDKERLATLKTEVVEGKEIMIYDKHCLHLIQGGSGSKPCCRKTICDPSEYPK